MKVKNITLAIEFGATRIEKKVAFYSGVNGVVGKMDARAWENLYKEFEELIDEHGAERIIDYVENGNE